MSVNVKFAGPKHRPIIKQIAERYINICRDQGIGSTPERQDIEMTVSAVFATGQVELDLDKLFKSSDFDFVHDVSGMLAYIDRATGRLGRCFLPRAAR